MWMPRGHLWNARACGPVRRSVREVRHHAAQWLDGAQSRADSGFAHIHKPYCYCYLKL